MKKFTTKDYEFVLNIFKTLVLATILIVTISTSKLINEQQETIRDMLEVIETIENDK